MTQEIVKDLLRFIVGYATQNDIRLTTLRLVKFLYLADLYYARKHEGRTLTGFPWAFVYYGPYCREVSEAIQESVNQGLIEMMTYESRYGEGKEYNLFSLFDEDAVEESEERLRVEVTSQLKAAIKKYGDDTPFLLDHVYFETEPMKEARQGDLLDFSKAKPIIPIRPISLKPIPKEKLELARSYVKALGERFERNRLRLENERIETENLKDELYYQALEAMEEEDLPVGLKGTIKIET